MRILNNPGIMAYDDLLVKLHKLISTDEDGRGDDIRDQLEAIWYTLDGTEVEVLDGASADLYMLNPTQEEHPWFQSPYHSWDDEAIREKFFEDWYTKKESSDQEEIADLLILLRTRPLLFSRETKAQARAILFAKLGLNAIAKEFETLACKSSRLTPREETPSPDSL